MSDFLSNPMKKGLGNQAFKQMTKRTADIFGGLAILTTLMMALDPWLCVPGFHRVCLFGINKIVAYSSTGVS